MIWSQNLDKGRYILGEGSSIVRQVRLTESREVWLSAHDPKLATHLLHFIFPSEIFNCFSRSY